MKQPKTPISIRLDSQVLDQLRSEALKLAIPYQTFIGSILARFVRGDIAQAPALEKRVGRPHAQAGWEAADKLQRYMIDLRAGKPFIPKGLYRFKTPEEAQAWMMKKLARR